MNNIMSKIVKDVIDLHNNGVDNIGIAAECGISVQSVEGIIETDSQNKIHISADEMSLWSISDEIDCESSNINGIANLLFCAGNSVTELSEDAMYALGKYLFSIHDKLDALSKAVCDIARDERVGK